MSNQELEELYRDLNSVEPERRIEAARRLAEQGGTGAAVLARALVEYPWLHEWKERIETLRDAQYTRFWENTPRFVPYRLYCTQGELQDLDQPPFHVFQRLLAMGKRAWPDIRRLLDHERVEVRFAGLVFCRIIIHTWPKAVKLLREALLQRLDDEEPNLRIYACLRLTEMDLQPTAGLFATLAEHYRKAAVPQERQALIQTLIHFRCPGEMIGDVVADFVRTSDPETHHDIFDMFHGSDRRKDAIPLIPLMLAHIRARLREPEPNLASALAVAYSLGYIGNEATEAILELAHDPDERHQQMALKAIVDGFPSDEDGRPFAGFLLERLEVQYAESGPGGHIERKLGYFRGKPGLDPENEARWAELQRRREEMIGGVASIEGMIWALRGNNPELMNKAAYAAKTLKERQAEVAPHLLHAMLHSSDAERACEDALKQLAPAIPDFAPELIALLEQNDIAARVLIEMAPRIASETPRLAALLAHENSKARGAALRIIQTIGPAALEHQPGLIEMLAARLEDAEESVRRGAILALGAMGAAAKPTAPQLMIAARSRSVKMVDAAREALARIAYANLEFGNPS